MDNNQTPRNLFDLNDRGEIRMVLTPDGKEEIRWIAEK